MLNSLRSFAVHRDGRAPGSYKNHGGTAITILRTCLDEQPSLCGDVPPGGGRVIECLAQNASQLSPRCRAAMAAVRN